MTNKHDLPPSRPGDVFDINPRRAGIPEAVQAVILARMLELDSPRDLSSEAKYGLQVYQILKAEMEKIDLGGTETSATEKE